jgi:crotonobetainyl-CoA:carnitine CoA-transferase CaiB-like acyl-CoA transferase
MSGPLSGLRVIDVSIMAAGPWIGTLLGQLGAEVIKVEPPAGDGTRWVEPLQHGMGTNYICLNLNKKGIILDFKKDEDRAAALALVAGADIFIQNFRVGVIERLGLGYEAVKSVNPGIVYCSVSGFGESGPLAKEACADFIMQAYSGFARLNGQPGDAVEAFRFTGYIDLTTSIVAVQAVLAALLARARTGQGQKVEISMLQAALEMQYTRIAELLNNGTPPVPQGSRSFGLVPDGAYKALDGDIFVTAHDQVQWKGFCYGIDRADLIEDPRFLSNNMRIEHRQQLEAILEPVIAQRPMIWWMRAMERQKVPCAMAQNFEQIRHHMQVCSNGMIEQITTPQSGQVVVAGLPWHFAMTPGKVLPPPVPGADTRQVLEALQGDRAPRIQGGSGATDATPLLKGTRILELASGVAGPMAACRLADLGAQVTKVENGAGDWTRASPPFLDDGTSHMFFALNRGKQSIVLDHDLSVRRTILRQLVERSDVLITDLTTDQLQALGLVGVDDDQCAWQPRLIVAQISAYGKQGPLAGKAGSELAAQAMAGYTRYLGVGGQPAVRLGADVAGCGTAIFTVQAILAAIYQRQRSGLGQRVDLSLLNSLLSMKTVHLAAQSDPDTFEGPRVGGAYDPPERGWATRDKPITFAFGGAVGAQGRAGWTEFVEAIGLSHMLDDPRYDKNGRLTTGLGPKARALKSEYEVAFRKLPASLVVEKVRQFGGFASAYLTHLELMQEPQVTALGIVQQVPGNGSQGQVLDFPAKFSDLLPTLNGNAPTLGQHTQVLTGMLTEIDPGN